MEQPDSSMSTCSKCGKRGKNTWYFSGLQQTLCPECHTNVVENTPEYRAWLEDYCPHSVADRVEHYKTEQYMRQKNN